MPTYRAYLFGFIGMDILATSGTTGTEAGYDAENVGYPNQHEYWRTDVGGTLRLSITQPSALFHVIKGMVITSPAGDGMIGSVTVRFYSTGPLVLLKTYVLERFSAAGSADRRYVIFEDETWCNDIERIEIDCAAGSEISRVALLNLTRDGYIANPVPFLELTPYLQNNWSIQIQSNGKIGENAGNAYFYSEDDLTTFKSFSGTLQAVDLANFDFESFYLNKSGYPEMVLIPHCVRFSEASAENLKLMHTSAIFGRMTGNFTAIYRGREDKTNAHLYDVPFKMEELI